MIRSPGKRTVVEEISEAYKDVADVVRVAHEAGISRKVARLVRGKAQPFELPYGD